MSSICQAETMAGSLEKARTLAAVLKQRIKTERHLTATIGIASNKLLAKIASDHKKPDGLTAKCGASFSRNSEINASSIGW